jgi:hypothetical protein
LSRKARLKQSRRKLLKLISTTLSISTAPSPLRLKSSTKPTSSNTFCARININGRTGHLGESESVKANNYNKRVNVKAETNFSKLYLKYLTKKYLKKHSLREPSRGGIREAGV